MQETKQQVFISDYMQSRRYNKTLYRRLVEGVNEKCKRLFKECPDVKISITMSAKYQTPMITISECDTVPEKIGAFEQEIISVLDNVGFEFRESEDKGSYYKINFKD
jgi:hypothetical protein